MVGNDLEVLYELLEGGFSEDDIDFGRKLDGIPEKWDPGPLGETLRWDPTVEP